MEKYWIAYLDNGQVIKEGDKNWADIKNNIIKLEYINNNQKITLPENLEEYLCAKTASSIIGSNKIDIESRYIGFKIGNNIVKIRINEKTNNISIEVNS